jgi:hypothetical protein
MEAQRKSFEAFLNDRRILTTIYEAHSEKGCVVNPAHCAAYLFL